MPFYDVWEKRTVFMENAGSPGVPPVQPPVSPPGIWPGPRPSHPIMLPGMPGWAGGGSPAQPPHIWPGPHPSHPIILPGMPGWEGPELPPEKPPIDPPTILPDFASPGFWTQVVYPQHTRPGFIQTSLNTDPDHEPNHPERGVPGQWIYVFNSIVGYTYTWIPELFDRDEATHKHRAKKK